VTKTKENDTMSMSDLKVKIIECQKVPGHA